MKVLMNEILAFQQFYEKIKDEHFPMKTAYKFMKFFKRVDEELTFYQKQIVQISEDYGERDSEGNLVLLEDNQSIKIQKEKIEECQKKLDELLNIETEIDEITFSLDELETLNLSLSDLQLIEKFITE